MVQLLGTVSIVLRHGNAGNLLSQYIYGDVAKGIAVVATNSLTFHVHKVTENRGIGEPTSETQCGHHKGMHPVLSLASPVAPSRLSYVSDLQTPHLKNRVLHTPGVR